MCLVQIGFSKPKTIKRKNREQFQKDVLSAVAHTLSTDSPASRILIQIDENCHCAFPMPSESDLEFLKEKTKGE